MRICNRHVNSFMWDVCHSFQSYVNIWIFFSMVQAVLLSSIQNLLNETFLVCIKQKIGENLNCPHS